MPDDRKLPNFNRQPMLWLAAAFAVGILAASLINLDLRGSIGVCAVFAAIAAIFRERHIASYIVLIAFAAAGAVSVQFEKLGLSSDRIRVLYDNGTIRSNDPVEVEGVLIGRPEPSIDGVFLNLRAEKIAYKGNALSSSGNVRLFLPQTNPDQSSDDFKSQISDLK